MNLKLLLDFDGVLFNSAFEAFSVCARTVAGQPSCRQDVGFEEFLEFRAVVTDAWQYNRLYEIGRGPARVTDLPEETADEQDWCFARRFFAARAEMLEDAAWAKIMSPYDFFFLLRPMLLAHHDRFAILSTRNVDSIRRTLAFYGADVVAVFGQEQIREHGSKLQVAQAQGWLDASRHLCVYVDDMNAHLEPFEGKVHLPLHADWGYDRRGDRSMSQHQVLNVLSSLLKLSGTPNADQV